MSAFMCSEADFATLAVFAIANKCGGLNDKGKPHKLARIANILGAENARSVNFRYRHNPEAQAKFVLLTGKQVRDAARKVSTAQIVKLCDCVDYQSCETGNWPLTDAYKILQAIKETALSMAASGDSAYPAAYEAAEWGFTS